MGGRFTEMGAAKGGVNLTCLKYCGLNGRKQSCIANLLLRFKPGASPMHILYRQMRVLAARVVLNSSGYSDCLPANSFGAATQFDWLSPGGLLAICRLTALSGHHEPLGRLMDFQNSGPISKRSDTLLAPAPQSIF